MEYFEFSSDNAEGICPEAWAALEKANTGARLSYGDDEWTARLCDRVREIFETDCEVFLVFNGTAGNALALAQLNRSYHSIICHEHAHLEIDECGACEFFSGGAKIILTAGANGKLSVAAMREALARQHSLHSHKPRTISFAQATELGTVYRPDEIHALSAFAQERGMFLHMDGARFANALATLGGAPGEITWRAGVDVLSLGGTKNGLAAGELVIFFSRELSLDFDYRAKQAGQLASKMRFLAAPWLGLLEDDVWLKNARRANEFARRLGSRLHEAGARLAFPIEANAVFLHLSERKLGELQKRGWAFYKFIEPDIYRLMCSWSTPEELIERFVDDFRGVNICAPRAV